MLSGTDGATRLVSNAFPSTTDSGDTAGRPEIYISGGQSLMISLA